MNQVAAVWGLSAAIVFCIGLYVYFVNITILQTAERQHVEESITDTKSHISQLELSFIDSNRTITKEYAQSMGFTEIASVAFINRSDTRLTLNEPQP